MNRNALSITAGLLMVHIVADAYLGDIAEYFNLWHVLLAWLSVIGPEMGPVPRFLYGQDALGIMALPLATVMIVAEAMITYHLVVYACTRFRVGS